MSDNKDISTAIDSYYSEKVRTFGATPKGVDWRDLESQNTRFQQLRRVFEGRLSSSVVDVGCGYGGMLPYLRETGFTGQYIGLDLSDEMIAKARDIHAADNNCRFLRQQEGGEIETGGDFVVASGIFNVRFDFDDQRWSDYILSTLEKIDRSCREGFAFNCLTSYSDPPRMRPDLFYADPCWLFDHCKRHFSRQVALLHDYGLYEFTILVRKS